jgi:hypothetical protein
MVLEEDLKLDGFLHGNCGACGLVYVGLDRSSLEEAVDSGIKFSFFRAQMYSDIHVTKFPRCWVKARTESALCILYFL